MRPGETLGNYLLRREIGGGGIAAVFIGEHHGDAQEVVLKVLRPELMLQQDVVALFLSEPRALMAVEHENTVEVTDVVDQFDLRLFATELLRGRTLSDPLKRGALELRRALAIARQVAAVLAHAHDVDVVHRNLKPANVFLARRNGTPDFVKLLELGATRMQSQGEKPVPGTLIGAPAYMAPEQLRQTAGDYRVDMYSFGVLLFEMVAGRRPFVGDLPDLVRRHLLEPAPRVRSLVPSVPASLDGLIARCLEKDPAARPPSMHEVSLAIGALAESLGPAPVVDEGPAPSVAVPKNTSGWATVPADATVAPPPLALDEDDEPSFESVTGERRAERADAPVAYVPASGAGLVGGSSSVPAAVPSAVPSSVPVPVPLPPAPLFELPDVTAELAALPRPHRPLWPAVAVGAGAVLALVVGVAVIGGGDDGRAADVPRPIPVDPVPPTPDAPPPDAAGGVSPPTPSDVVRDAGLDLPPVAPLDPSPAAPAMHQVGFGSTPAGAQVWIRMDKRIRMLCTTPCTFALPEGKEVLVELRKDGWVSAQRTFVVGEGARFDGVLKRP